MIAKTVGFTRISLMLVALALPAHATTRYVNPTGASSPGTPYTSWATAAYSIQAAVDVAVNGDTILVASGEHWLSAEISVTKNITIASVDGPEVSIIDGRGLMRCFNLGSSACVILGFTIKNGYAPGLPNFGGGIRCDSNVPIVTNCIISGNYGTYGGGMYKGTANNCTIINNNAYEGGGLYTSEANNCLIVGNHSTANGGGMYLGTAINCTLADNDANDDGGGMFYGIAKNCIAYYNIAGANGWNFSSTIITSSCYQPATPGDGNIGQNPQFINRPGGDYRLASNSPCINKGVNASAVGSTDLDGNPRIIYDTVDMGAYEFLVPVNYVSPGGSHLFPFSSWATAATNVQSAVDAAVDGKTVIVTNGTYGLAAEITIAKNITLQSVNGPTATIIDGNYNVRCFNVGNSACEISGFTIQHGYPGDFENGGGLLCSSTTPVVTNCTVTANEGNLGGGMYGGTANDCTFSANYGYNGGGIQSANANRCIISGNNAPVGGGTVGGILNDCTITNNYASAYGGGIYGSTANRCTIRNNTSGNRGGGMDNGVANNCLIINNTAYNNGGGIYESTANNCTIRGNTAYENGGGSYDSTLKNSIVWYNSAPVGNDIWLGDPEYSYGSSSYTCSPDVTHNQNGNTTATPLFIDNYHPAFNSPTLNVGNNSGVAATDFDGRPRMVNGTVDMGACEYDAAFYDSNTDGIPDSWGIQYFGSATGGLASANGDADPADNGNEYVAGTDPTNAASFFHVTSQAAVPGGFVVNWDAVPGRVYNVHWTDSLTNGFQSVESSIPYPQNSYTDTVHTAEANSFYELEVAQAE